MMSLTYEDDECNECIYYVKPVSNSSAWRCCLCLIAETAICLDGETTMWDRYELPCGHEAHERCYRTWAKKEGKVGCPRCIILDKVEAYRYCETCDRFGHPKTADCIVKKSRDDLLKHAAEAKEEREKQKEKTRGYLPFSLPF